MRSEVAFDSYAPNFVYVKYEEKLFKNNKYTSVLEQEFPITGYEDVELLDYFQDTPYIYENGSYAYLCGMINQSWGFISVDKSKETLTIKAADRSLKLARSAVERFADDFDDYLHESLDGKRIKIYNTYKAGGHVERNSTKIDIKTWDEIDNNYTKNTRESIESLHEMDFQKSTGGSLIILQGGTGTGKTYYLTSLLYRLNDDYKIYNISDAQTFAAQLQYYTELCHNDTVTEDTQDCIFVLEDSADLVLQSSRGKETMESFLNLSDGLLSAGRNDLFIVTANEPLEDIDPAILRHGRCLKVIEFDKFSKGGAEEWLSNRGMNADLPNDQYSLSELYEILRGEDNESEEFEERNQAGF